MNDASRIPRTALFLLALGVAVALLLAARTRPNDPCRDPEAQRRLAGLPAAVRVRDVPVENPSMTPLSVTGDLAADPEHTAYAVHRSLDIAGTTSAGVQLLRIPMDPHESWTETIDVDGEAITIQWTRELRLQTVHQAGRILFLGRRAVDSLLRTQLTSAVDQLRSGSEPITLYVVEIIAPKLGLEERTVRATDWLVAATRQFRATCGTEQ